MRMEAMKNTTKAFCLKRTNASAPSICANVVLVPFALGGVAGKAKLINPSKAEATAAMMKVGPNCSVEILKT